MQFLQWVGVEQDWNELFVVLLTTFKVKKRSKFRAIDKKRHRERIDEFFYAVDFTKKKYREARFSPNFKGQCKGHL